MKRNLIYDIGTHLMDQLIQKGHEVIAVLEGTSFAKKNKSLYYINPKKSEDYNTLLEQIHVQLQHRFPQRLIHLWAVDQKESKIEIKDVGVDGAYEVEQLEKHLPMGFYSLIYLAKALGNRQEETWDILRSGGVHVVTDVATENAVDKLIELLQ